MKRKKSKTKDRLLSFLQILMALVFLFSAFMLARYFIKGHSEQNAFDELSDIVAESEEESINTEETGGRLLPRYAKLVTMNSDLCGWIKVPGTRIDYPVVCTPNDVNYYLRRAFDGSYATCGTPFLGAGCTADSDCVIIHGHNMRNKSMFGTLDKYKDPDFCKENPVLYFDSLYEERSYTVFAAIQCRVVPDGVEGYRYYEHGGMLDAEQREELVNWLVDNSLYDTGCTPPDTGRIVILSTCSYHTSDGRFIVAAYENDDNTDL